MAGDERFKYLDFDDFRELAKDNSLSKYEKIGFPDSYREGYEEVIFEDICNKISNIKLENTTVLDIGPGCSDLPNILVDQSRDKRQSLIFVDNAEMLAHLPDEPFIKKIEAMYPCCP